MAADPLLLLGISGGIDRNGVLSVDVPMWVATLREALSVRPDIDLGIPLVSRSFKQSEEGGYEVTVHYEGLDGKEPSDDQITFEFDISMSEDPPRVEFERMTGRLTNRRYCFEAAKSGLTPKRRTCQN